MVIELEEPAAPVRVFALPPAGGGNRFVIDLLDRGKTAFLVASSALEKTPNIDLSDAVTDHAMVKDTDRVKTVYNEAYAVSDNLVSCWTVHDEMSSDFILLNGDTLFEASCNYDVQMRCAYLVCFGLLFVLQRFVHAS